MDISKFRSKEYLESLLNNPEEFVKNANLSKGVLYFHMKRMGINLPVEKLTGEYFNIFAIGSLENALKEQGKNEEQTKDFVIKEIESYDARLISDIKKVNHNGFWEVNKEDVRKVFKSQYQEIFKNSNYKESLKKSGAASVLADLLDEYKFFEKEDEKSDVQQMILNRDFQGLLDKGNVNFSNLYSELKEAAREDLLIIKQAEANEDYELVEKKFKNWMLLAQDSEVRRDITSSLDTLAEVVGYVKLTRVPQYVLKYGDWDNITYLSDDEKPIIKKFIQEKVEGKKKLRKESFKTLKTLNLDWNIAEDRDLIVKYANKIAGNRDSYKEFFRTFKDISKEDIKQYLPAYTPKFNSLSKSEQLAPFVMEKIFVRLQKTSSSGDDIIDINELVNFFVSTDTYSSAKIEIPREVLDNLWKEAEKRNVKILVDDIYYSSWGLTEPKVFALMQIATKRWEYLLERNEWSKTQAEESLLEMKKIFECCIEQEHSYFKIVPEFKNYVLAFEQNALKVAQKSLSYVDSNMLFDNEFLKEHSAEFTAIFRVALAGKEKLTANDFYTLFLNCVGLYEHPNVKNYHGHIRTKDLMKEGYSVEEIMGVKYNLLDSLTNDPEIKKSMVAQVAHFIEEESYRASSRIQIWDEGLYFDEIMRQMRNKFQDRNNFSHLSDKEYAEELNAVNMLLKSRAITNRLDKDFLKDWDKNRKNYVTDKLPENFILNPQNFNGQHSNFIRAIKKTVGQEGFLSSLNKDNFYSDEKLSSLINHVIFQERKNSSSNGDEVALIYAVAMKIMKETNGVGYTESKKGLLKTLKAKEFQKYLKDVKMDVSFKDFLESDNKEKWEDILESVGSEKAITHENITNLFKSMDKDKITFIIEKWGHDKTLSEVVSHLDYEVQKPLMLTLKDDVVPLRRERYNHNDKGFSAKFNCVNLEQLKEVYNFFIDKERVYTLLIGEKYNSLQVGVNWESSKLLSFVNVPNTDEAVNFLIEKFPLSSISEFSMENAGDEYPRKRGFDASELIKLKKLVQERNVSYFLVGDNPNADFDWLKFHPKDGGSGNRRGRSEESLLEINGNLNEFLDILEGLKEHPDLYCLFVRQNLLYIDNLRFRIIERENPDDYQNHKNIWSEIPQNLSPLYEFSTLIKQSEAGKEMMGEKFDVPEPELDSDYVTAMFLANLVDTNILLKGFETIVEENQLSAKNVNHRLEERFDLFMKYGLSYSCKLDRSQGRYSYNAPTVQKTAFDEETNDKVIFSLLDIAPATVFYESFFLTNQKIKQFERMEGEEHKQFIERISPEVVNLVLDEYMDKNNIQSMLSGVIGNKVLELSADEAIPLLIKNYLGRTLSGEDFREFVDFLDFSEKEGLRIKEYDSELNSLDAMEVVRRNMYGHSLMYKLARAGYQDEDDTSLEDIRTLLDAKWMEMDIMDNKSISTTTHKPKKF